MHADIGTQKLFLSYVFYQKQFSHVGHSDSRYILAHLNTTGLILFVLLNNVIL